MYEIRKLEFSEKCMGSHAVPVTWRGAFDSVKEELPLFGSQASARAFARRPSEGPALETLRADPEPGAVEPDHLHTVARTVGVYEQMSGTRIFPFVADKAGVPVLIADLTN